MTLLCRDGDGEMDREKVIKGLEICTKDIPMSNAVHKSDFCKECPYYNAENRYCWNQIVMMRDALALLKEQEEEHRRLLSWLGKFCRHIDNGDAWLTDEENIAFFKEKMKQQFGWDTD